MANFNVLPLELIDEIIKLVLVTGTRHLPMIGLDASCFAPHCTDMKEISGVSRAESFDSVRPVCSISLKSETNCSQSSFGFYVMAASLRLVNRTFNKISPRISKPLGNQSLFHTPIASKPCTYTPIPLSLISATTRESMPQVFLVFVTS